MNLGKGVMDWELRIEWIWDLGRKCLHSNPSYYCVEGAMLCDRATQ